MSRSWELILKKEERDKTGGHFIKMRNNLVAEYIGILKNKKIYHSPKSLIWYYDKYLFQNYDVTGKNVLDIGGGIGMISFYAAIKGAAKVHLLEPELEGSGSFHVNNYNVLHTKLRPFSEVVEKRKVTFQNFQAKDRYDFMFLYASINHLDENSCVSLLIDDNSKKTYLKIFKKMRDMSNSGAKVIIIDCMRKNFFNCIGLKSPFARSIDWNKHQMPETWACLMRDAGFHSPKIEYLAIKQLRTLGSLIMGNKFSCFIMGTLFSLTLTAE